MSENIIPKLTLTPDTEQVPALTLSSEIISQPAEALEKKEPAEARLDESMLSEAERLAVSEFAEKIDIKNTGMVLQYGAAAQKSVAAFSENALANVKTKDLGEIGNTLSALVAEVRGFSAIEEKKGLLGMFNKAKNQMAALKIQYNKASVNVDKITQVLENHQITLMKDIAMFDKLYELNLQYYKELTMYILAGKKKLEKTRNEDLEVLRLRAAETGTHEDAQAYNDLSSMCVRFEKKLHDLELTRVISIQTAPQIRLIQNNDAMMCEKIQSSIVNTIPLWKSQMVLALGMENAKQATAAQRAVTDATNELLRRNAEALRMGTVETAKEAERSIVDIETLKNTNAQLISTLDEVLQIQREGAEKRRAAEIEIGKIEGELKQKLLELRN